MSLFSDASPPPSSPEKPKMSVEERRARIADRLITIHLRMLISQDLDARGITMPVAIGAALGMSPAEAVKLMTGRRWREGDVARLLAVMARLGVEAPPRTEIDMRLQPR